MWFKFIVVGVKAGEKSRTAEVFLKYRGNDSPFHVPDQQLAAFCLPLGPESQSQKERMSQEEYTFTLTQGDGTRVQGFCRRFLPPAPRIGSKLRFPQVLCLVCEASWSALFFKVLEAVEQLLRQTNLLLDFGNRELPADSYAGQFLSNLAAAVAEQPQLGSVIRLPLPSVPTPLSMSPPKRVLNGVDNEPLQFEVLELQVPPDCGNGLSNAGVSLARLLWHVPVPAMLTLIASLLLERRVLVVGQSRDMVSAAVCAAAALIYPFKWHHIYLPLLPRSFKDYLTAPMPFLIGMPAQLLPTLKGIPMDEVTLIDLDLGRCEPSAGSAHDDSMRLPWREQLETALHAAFGMLRSPTEHESNPLITNIMQGYFLKLVGSYRSHIYPEGVGPGTPNGYNSLSHSPSAAAMHQSTSTGSLVGLNGAREDSFRNLSNLQSPRDGAGSTGRHTPTGSVMYDDSMKGHGYWFDHTGLVASHRRNERARSFLQLLRQSQMYEMFIQERLKMFATVPGGPELSGDPFEQLVNSYLDNRSRQLAARLGAGVRSSLSRFTAFVKKHRRTGSHIPEAGSIPGFGGSLMERPEAQRIKQLAAAFASVAVNAGQMRRNFTEGNSLATLSAQTPGQAVAVTHHRHTLSSVEGLADKISSTLDPSAFFEDDDEELDAEAADAAAAASSSGRPGMSRNNSNSSLKDIMASAASWTAGNGNSSRIARGSVGGALEQQQQQSTQSLQRQSVPAAAAASGVNLARQSTPLIDLRQSSPSSSGSSRPGSTTPPLQPHASHFLQQQQQHLQQQQQQDRPLRSSISSIADQLLGGNSNLSSGQQHRPRSPAGAFAAAVGPGSAAAAAAANHRTSQHMHMKAALASIAPGPLPQPPQPKPRSSSSHLSFNSVLGSSSSSHVGASSHSSMKPPLQPHQQQQQQQVGPAAAVWDPFMELVQERSSSAVLPPQQQQQQPVGDKVPAMQLVALTPPSGSGSGSSVSSPVSKAVSSSRGSSSSDGGAYAGSTCSTVPAADVFLNFSSRGASSAEIDTDSRNSSIGRSQQQQQQTGDLLELGPQLSSVQLFPLHAESSGVCSLIDAPIDIAGGSSSAARLGEPVVLGHSTPVVATAGNSSRSSVSGQIQSAAATAQGGDLSTGGSSYATAGSSAVSSAAGDAGLAQLEELLLQQTVSVAGSDSLLDM